MHLWGSKSHLKSMEIIMLYPEMYYQSQLHLNQASIEYPKCYNNLFGYLVLAKSTQFHSATWKEEALHRTRCHCIQLQHSLHATLTGPAVIGWQGLTFACVQSWLSKNKAKSLRMHSYTCALQPHLVSSSQKLGRLKCVLLGRFYYTKVLA